MSLLFFGALCKSFFLWDLHIVIFFSILRFFSPVHCYTLYSSRPNSPKLSKIKTLSTHSFWLVPSWPDNIKAWFCCVEADFREHAVTEPHAQFVEVVKAPLPDFNRYVTPSLLTNDVSEPYKALEKVILKLGDLLDYFVISDVIIIDIILKLQIYHYVTA